MSAPQHGAERKMQRVCEGRRQIVVPCPSCRQPIGLWLCIQAPGEYAAAHGAVDITASLLEPAQRAAAMKRAAEFSEKSTVTPWVTCFFCGYDDHYVLGASA